MNDLQYQFEWDEKKAAANVFKHGVSFELASTIFTDPGLLTVPDLARSRTEERWFSIGSSSDGRVLFVVYLWSESEPPTTKVRIISARRATPAEIRQYEESQ